MKDEIIYPVGPGRRYAPDMNDRFYPLRASALPMITLPASRHWKTGPITNQGQTPQCVGYSWLNFLMAAPIMTRNRQLPAPTEIYHQAQKIDEWPGEQYEGTSVRAGVKVLQELGLVTEYRWATDADVFKRFILSRGPLVVGTDWFSGMSQPRWVDNKHADGPRNDAYLEPSGSLDGGHAYLIVGYSKPRNAYRMYNSWGQAWGESGRAWVAADVLHHLVFGLNGEACSAVESTK